MKIDRHGIEFERDYDGIIWLWPWRRNGGPKFISIGLSGNGDFGDARFNTLREIDEAWASVFDARTKGGRK